MSKIMVVEDDASLREIYSIRITAEGYDVISAGDGEEALAMAVREKPDLILSDVMMPKISGFDMLDILRSTPETSGIRIIMMTALSAEDQRQRGERLGADRYLVKSQVGIEDVINTIHEVLGDRGNSGAAPVQPSQPANASPSAPSASPTSASTATNMVSNTAPTSTVPTSVVTPNPIPTSINATPQTTSIPASNVAPSATLTSVQSSAPTAATPAATSTGLDIPHAPSNEASHEPTIQFNPAQ